MSISVPESRNIPRRVKLLFWLLLGALSVILAEVVSFASPFPFFDFWALVVVCPLYTLHVLVLAGIIFRQRRVTLPTLFLAGAIFGMYEAYMTKVLWNPTWGEYTWSAGGVYVIQAAILILFWHPWMAFILPLVIAEGSFTTSDETLQALPGRLQKMLRSPSRVRWMAMIFALCCGLTQGVNSPSVGVSLLSGAAAGVVFWGLALLWQRVSRERAYALRDLLPAGGEILALGLLLLAGYGVLGAILRPEALPRETGPHLTVWGMYLLLFVLLAANLRKAPVLPSPDIHADIQFHAFTWQEAALFWLVFPLASAIFSPVKTIAVLGVLLSWILGVGMGLVMLAQAAWAALKPAAPTSIQEESIV